ncbi:MAG: aconitate hydratase B, partial [Candidatus Aminicenantes bacterium]|nr:aconitate hydratase B [Candidatus Aminicenantes bacterium]
MLEAYFKHVQERSAQGIPPRPLSPDETEEVCRLLENPPPDKADFLRDLLTNRVSPGVDSAAKVKAEWLGQLATGAIRSPALAREEAIRLLGTMLGGYNTGPLTALLEDETLAKHAAQALKGVILIYGGFDVISRLAKSNGHAREVLESWARGEWFLSRPALPDSIVLTVYKVEGEINTDDFSPAKHASTRPDIPLHALAMGETRFPDGLKTIARFRAEGRRVMFVGDVVGTGSSRKSATNSVLWHIGEDIPCVPNKRRGGVVLGGLIAPIVYNTVEDSGGLPIMCEVTSLKTGEVITLDFKNRAVKDQNGKVLVSFEIKPSTLQDEFRAGGRLNLIIGRALTGKARAVLGWPEADFFIKVQNPAAKPCQGYSQAQKIVGRACGQPGILPGTACEPKMTTVGSQDTTGPMTADELKELACLEFQAGLFMQSF